MKKALIFVLAAASIIASCNKAEVKAPVSESSRVVKFETANLYAFSTKTAIAADGVVGIYASSPAEGGANASYTVKTMPGAETNGTLEGSAILWGIQQVGTNTASKFFAMYPYASSTERGAFNESTPLAYSIKNDGDEEYAADFLVDVVEQAPGEDVENPAKVTFNLEHPFAKLRYVITNNSDDAIKSVAISGVKKTGTLTYSDAKLTATGDAVVDRNMPLESSEGNVLTYYSVVVPETAAVNPTIKITTWTGATSTFSLSEAVVLSAGNVYTATITYNHSHAVATSNRTMTSEFAVTDWTGSNVTAGAEAGYTSSTADWPIIKGSNFGSSWEQGLRMSCVGENSFRKVITATGAVEFKIYTENGAWYGFSATTAEADDWTKITTSTDSGAANITNIDAAGTYTVYFYSDSKEVWIKSGDVTR